MADQPHHQFDGLTTPDYVQSPGLVAALLEQLPLGVGLLDCEGRWLLTNAALRSFVGDVLPSRDPEQMRRWRAWDQHGNAIGPQDWPSARALRGEMVCDGLEMLYQPPGRLPVWTRVRSTPLRNQNGELIGAITKVEDIDQRKRAEEALRDNERRLQQANDYLEFAQIAGSVGFFDYNPEQDCCLWTEGMNRLYGIAPEEYDGTWRGWAMRVVADDAERTRRDLEAAISAGAEQVRHEFRVVLPDGTVRWMAGRGRIYYGAHGKPLRVIGVNIDITDQKKAEEKRIASEERLRLATEAAGFGVYDTDPLDRASEWSANLRAMFGMPPEGPVEVEQMVACIHPRDRERMRAAYQAVMEGRYADGWKFEFQATSADGRVRWFSDTGRPLWAERNGVTRVDRLVGVLYDSTQRVAQEDALRESRTQLAAEVTALEDLHALVTRWAGSPDLLAAMSETLDAALRLVGSDQGTVQVLEEGGGDLKMLVHRGFTEAALEAGAGALAATGSPCALAMESGQRVTIEDVDQDARAAAHAPVAQVFGYRSASSTPLRTIQDKLLGTLTVYFREPHRMTERELRLIDLCAQHAAHLIEQRRTEQARRESEDRFRTMADVSPVIIWMTDTTGEIEFINQAFRTFCGVTDDDVRERRWRLIVHPEDREAYVGEFLRCVREHRAFEGRCRIKRADGEWRWIASSAAPRFSSEGHFLGHVGSSPDIHELMTAQQSLQASEERLRLAMTGGEMGAWQIELSTGEVRWDARQCDIFGVERPPGTIEEFYALLHPDDRNRIQVAAAATDTTRRFAEEFRVIHPHRGLRWVAGLGALVHDQTGRPVRMVGVNFDVTERREAQARIERFAEELNRQVGARTRELVASQERLRALATELNLAEQRERKRLAAELHDHLQQTLVLGKLKVGQGKRAVHGLPALSEVMDDVDEVLSEALDYTRTLVSELSPPVLRDHGLAAGLHWLARYMKKRDMAVTVHADGAEGIQLPEEQALLLFQSVRELLINSSKHAGIGEATVTVECAGGCLRIDVADEGVGFDLAAVSRDGAAEAGAGLSSKFGLFSIDERMRAMGGVFELRSSPGHGTAATLVLPLQTRSQAGRDQKPMRVACTDHGRPEPLHRPAGPSLVRVLLADDHTMVRQGLRSLLESYADVEVVGEAWDGHEAVLAVERLNPTVVVMDINMPKKNGIEATAEITSRHPGVTVIGLSVNAEGDSQAAMLNAGAAKLLTKEAAVEHLYDAIQDALHR